ncbi:Uncharacterised protein [Legionella donaldsonii]|uniref:Uncharacterized protein n=1 Tax=Legionella donaldsonii TaxID=45060 RepID=A0A378JD15_9GAMM|nr:Uncharacterised protein [Legionella donaldsonii]
MTRQSLINDNALLGDVLNFVENFWLWQQPY